MRAFYNCPPTITTEVKNDMAVAIIKANLTMYGIYYEITYYLKARVPFLFANITIEVYNETNITSITYAFGQICSIWVTTDPGEMAWFDYYIVSGSTEGAIDTLPKQDNFLEATYVTNCSKYAALKASDRGWIQGIILRDPAKADKVLARIKTGGSYEGWTFARDILILIYNHTEPVPQGTTFNVPLIIYADNSNSFDSIELVALETFIPEFPSTLILTLFILTTLIATVLWKTKRKRQLS